MLGVGGGEIIVIALVAVILFGTEDLPKNLKKFMKAWNNFRGVTTDFQRGWYQMRDQVTRDILYEPPPNHQSNTENAAQSDAQGEAVVAASGENQSSSEGADHAGAQQTADDGVSGNVSQAESGEQTGLPHPQPAHGILPRGESEEIATASTLSAPDKST